MDEDGYLKVPETGGYEVVYEANGTTYKRSEVNNTALINLQEDNEYTFYVYFTREDYHRRAIATCSVDTNTRRSKILALFYFTSTLPIVIIIMSLS